MAAFRPETGELLLICDGTLPTMYRTAAAAAVSAKYLARSNAATLSIIGAGQLGRQCLRSVSSIRPFQKVYLHDLFPDAANRLMRDLTSQTGFPTDVVDAQTACTEGDVIVTATNSRHPIVQEKWIKPGTHLCCMGSDLHEKIECEITLLPRCRLFADFIEHAVKRGEVSQAVEQGCLAQNCYAATLGQVINGDIPGRTNDEQITLYDGVGIGIQDTTIARTIYDQALARNLGTPIRFS